MSFSSDGKSDNKYLLQIEYEPTDPSNNNDDEDFERSSSFKLHTEKAPSNNKFSKQAAYASEVVPTTPVAQQQTEHKPLTVKQSSIKTYISESLYHKVRSQVHLKDFVERLKIKSRMKYLLPEESIKFNKMVKGFMSISPNALKNQQLKLSQSQLQMLEKHSKMK